MGSRHCEEKPDFTPATADPDLRDDAAELRAELKKAQDRLKLIELALDTYAEEIYVKDTDLRFVVANKATAEINDLKQSEIIGKTDADIFEHRLATAFREKERDLLRTGVPAHEIGEGTFRKSGRPHWYQSSKFAVVDEDGELLGLAGISRHITTQKQTEFMLRAQSEILEMVAAHKPLEKIFERIIRTNDDQFDGVESSILLLNKAGCVFESVVAGTMPREYCDLLIGLEISDNTGSCGTACYRKEIVIVEDIETDPKWAPFRHLVAPYGYRSCWSAPIIRSDGSVAGSFALYSKNVRKPDAFEMQIVQLGQRLAAIAIDSHAAAEAIRITAETDALTGLTNRSAFNRLLNEAVDKAGSSGERFAAVYIDLDDFKLINDQHGHLVGDEYLKCVAGRMKRCAGPDDTVSRIGGDEFVLLMNVGESEDLRPRLEELLNEIIKPVVLDELLLEVSASAGVALYPDDAQSGDELLARADLAMYFAKRVPGLHIKFYHADIDREIRTRKLRIAELKAGIEADQIDLDFQPQYDLRTGEIIGFEALARWQSPAFGRLGPAYFIELAEEADLIVPLGEKVLQQACLRASEWRRIMGRSVRVAVNVSAHQFRDGILLDQVERVLEESGLDPRFLELELTESVLMQDVTSAVRTMWRLKSIGVETSLDDFGTGYSNLSALAAFPLDRLKIDRSIIQDIRDNEAAASIASAIIAMGHKLQMQVLAEGVETVEQVDFLAANDCDFAQGFLMSRPVGFDEAVRMLEKEQELSSGKRTPQASVGGMQ